MFRLSRTSYRSKSARCFPQESSTVQLVGTARACSRAALIRDVSMAFRDLGATPFSINRLRRRLESWTTAIRPSGNSTSPSCQAIPSGAASGSVIQASLGSWLTVLVHHVPSPWVDPHLDVGSVRGCAATRTGLPRSVAGIPCQRSEGEAMREPPPDEPMPGQPDEPTPGLPDPVPPTEPEQPEVVPPTDPEPDEVGGRH
jgi:hypothetical protein